MFWISVFIEINKIIVMILVKVEVRIISPVDWHWASLMLFVPKGPKLVTNHHYDVIG